MPHAMRLVFALTLALAAALPPAYAMPPDPTAEARRLQNAGKLEEAAAILKRLSDANPYSGRLIANYGYCLHAMKRYDESIAALERAIALGHAPSGNMYNIACAHALAGRKDEALRWLEKAYDAGFAEQETVEGDSDMDALRSDERFIRITGLYPPAGLSREDQWRYDLDYFARRMKQMHWDLYAVVGEANFTRAVEELKRDVPKLKDHEVLLRLKKIVASVGDGHTSMSVRRPDEPTAPSLPVGFYHFTDGMYVRSADPDHKDLLGARVLKFGAMDARDAFERAKPYCSVDNEMGYLDGVPRLLGSPLILEAIGAAPDASGAELTLRLRDGAERVVKLRAVQMDLAQVAAAPWPQAHELTRDPPPPLYLTPGRPAIWREYIPDRKLLYLYFGGVEDPEGSTLARAARETFDFIETNDVRHLVIDMRLNGGGDTGLFEPLLHGLIACGKVNRHGGLFVVIGRRTFSAAQNAASLIETHTHATFVGEPTGSRPNFVGESTFFYLPYHKNRVYCSSRYWQFRVSTDKRPWIEPQIAAPLSFEDYVRNRDPALAEVYTAIDAGWPNPPATAPASAAAPAPAAAHDVAPVRAAAAADMSR